MWAWASRGVSGQAEFVGVTPTQMATAGRAGLRPTVEVLTDPSVLADMVVD
jgi:hypothetical protein